VSENERITAAAPPKSMGDASGLAMGRKERKGATAKAEEPSAARAVLSAALRVRVFFIPNG